MLRKIERRIMWGTNKCSLEDGRYGFVRELEDSKGMEDGAADSEGEGETETESEEDDATKGARLRKGKQIVRA